MEGTAELQIRRYLDEQGGLVKVPAYHLLTSWRAERFDEENRRDIEHALARVGVYCEPSLARVRETKQVTLFLSERDPSRRKQRRG